jgi:hypothetical protein
MKNCFNDIQQNDIYYTSLVTVSRQVIRSSQFTTICFPPKVVVLRHHKRHYLLTYFAIRYLDICCIEGIIVEQIGTVVYAAFVG